MALTNRRTFLLGFGAVLAAPAIVRAESLMKVIAPKPVLIHLPPKPWYFGELSVKGDTINPTDFTLLGLVIDEALKP